MDKQQEIDCLREKCKRHQEEHERACEKMDKQKAEILTVLSRATDLSYQAYFPSN